MLKHKIFFLLLAVIPHINFCMEIEVQKYVTLLTSDKKLLEISIDAVQEAQTLVHLMGFQDESGTLPVNLPLKVAIECCEQLQYITELRKEENALQQVRQSLLEFLKKPKEEQEKIKWLKKADPEKDKKLVERLEKEISENNINKTIKEQCRQRSFFKKNAIEELIYMCNASNYLGSKLLHKVTLHNLKERLEKNNYEEFFHHYLSITSFLNEDSKNALFGRNIRHRYNLFSLSIPQTTDPQHWQKLFSMASSQECCLEQIQGNNLVTTSNRDNAVCLWDLTTRSIKRRFNHSGSVESILLSRDTNKLITLTRDKTLYIWDVLGEDSPEMYPLGFSGRLKWLSNDNKYLFLERGENGFVIIKVKKYHLKPNPFNYDGSRNPLVICKNGNRLAAIVSYALDIHDICSGKQLGTTSSKNWQQGIIKKAVFNDDGTLVAIIRNKFIELFDLRTINNLEKDDPIAYKYFTTQVKSVEFSPCGNYFIVVTADEVIKLFRINYSRMLSAKQSVTHVNKSDALELKKNGLIGVEEVKTLGTFSNIKECSFINAKNLRFIKDTNEIFIWDIDLEETIAVYPSSNNRIQSYLVEGDVIVALQEEKTSQKKKRFTVGCYKLVDDELLSRLKSFEPPTILAKVCYEACKKKKKIHICDHESLTEIYNFADEKTKKVIDRFSTHTWFCKHNLKALIKNSYFISGIISGGLCTFGLASLWFYNHCLNR